MQLHDVTGKVQSAGPCIAVQMHEVRVAALELRKIKKKRINLENKSKPRFRVNRISQVRGETPCSGHRIDL